MLAPSTALRARLGPRAEGQAGPYTGHRACARAAPRRASRAAAAAKESANASSLSEEYTDVMQERMGSTGLTYRHELGMNFNRIMDDLIVGSCLQTVDDVDSLAEREGVRTVLCLQEDCDMEYFSLDLAPITARAAARGDVSHLRHWIRDFDPFSLRLRLPGAVSLLATQAAANGGTAYIHCTAGLGRAPATALAYMWWVRGVHLEEGHALLTGVRPCSPKLAAIRAATVDVLYPPHLTPVTLGVTRRGLARSVAVAGLDMGWGCPLELAPDGTGRLAVTRHLPPGTYQFKMVVDGRWSYSGDHPLVEDGGNLNNVVVVPDLTADEGVRAARARLLAEGGRLTGEEADALRAKLLGGQLLA